MTLTVGSLFSGIGGLDLGLERAGMRVIWQSEIDPYATRVLAKHWPGVPNYGDITRIDWSDIVRPDVICGGYPCQPFSLAGVRRGEDDPRHLWPYVRDAISHLRPRFAILENVRGHLSLGGLSVLSDLTALGYDAEWRIVSAASVGANHRRDRIIIVAYPNGEDEPDESLDELGMVADADGIGSQGSRPKLKTTRATRGSQNEREIVADADGSHAADGGERKALSGEDRGGRNDRGGSDGDPREVTIRGAGEDPGDVADAHSRRLEEREPERQQIYRISSASELPNYDGFRWWQTEPDVGRVAHGVPSRVDRLRGLGNAVVPQVAEVIGRLIVAHHEESQR